MVYADNLGETRLTQTFAGGVSTVRRPTQAMDDSGITQVLALPSEPSLSPASDGKGAGGRLTGGGEEEAGPPRALRLLLSEGA